MYYIIIYISLILFDKFLGKSTSPMDPIGSIFPEATMYNSPFDTCKMQRKPSAGNGNPQKPSFVQSLG